MDYMQKCLSDIPMGHGTPPLGQEKHHVREKSMKMH